MTKISKNAYTTLHYTYRKAASGRPITGGPTLAEIMSKVKDCNIDITIEKIKFLKIYGIMTLKLSMAKKMK